MTETKADPAEASLPLFEEAVKKRSLVVGMEQAVDEARTAGLEISDDGQVVEIRVHPLVLLLRMIKNISESGDLRSLEDCTPLIDLLTRSAEQLDRDEL